MKLNRLSTCLVFALPFAVACTGSADNAGSGAESDLTNHQAGTDVQVLQIWTVGRVFPSKPGGELSPTAKDVTLDAASCPGTATSGNTKEVDCSDAFAKAAPFDDGKPGPVLDPIQFAAITGPRGTFIEETYCDRVEVRVVARDAATSQPSFAGIGFFTGRGSSFAPKSQLQAVGHVTLKSGDAATVYRFNGLSTCVSASGNSTSGNMYQTFAFKPYAAYDQGGDRFQVWEAIAGNHVIGRSWPGEQPVVNSDSFDRQGELLK